MVVAASATFEYEAKSSYELTIVPVVKVTEDGFVLFGT